jgi:hypothetical protein
MPDLPASVLTAANLSANPVFQGPNFGGESSPDFIIYQESGIYYANGNPDLQLNTPYLSNGSLNSLLTSILSDLPTNGPWVIRFRPNTTAYTLGSDFTITSVTNGIFQMAGATLAGGRFIFNACTSSGFRDVTFGNAAGVQFINGCQNPRLEGLITVNSGAVAPFCEVQAGTHGQFTEQGLVGRVIIDNPSPTTGNSLQVPTYHGSASTSVCVGFQFDAPTNSGGGSQSYAAWTFEGIWANAYAGQYIIAALGNANGSANLYGHIIKSGHLFPKGDGTVGNPTAPLYSNGTCEGMQIDVTWESLISTQSAATVMAAYMGVYDTLASNNPKIPPHKVLGRVTKNPTTLIETYIDNSSTNSPHGVRGALNPVGYSHNLNLGTNSVYGAETIMFGATVSPLNFHYDVPSAAAVMSGSFAGGETLNVNIYLHTFDGLTSTITSGNISSVTGTYAFGAIDFAPAFNNFDNTSNSVITAIGAAAVSNQSSTSATVKMYAQGHRY